MRKLWQWLTGRWVVTSANYWGLALEEWNTATGEYRHYLLTNEGYLSYKSFPGPHPRHHEKGRM